MHKQIRNMLTVATLPFAISAAFAADAPTLSAEAKAASGKIYFERCAGCHGMLRKGATGKNLEPANTAKLGASASKKSSLTAPKAACRTSTTS
jgi:nitrite reductase (NO-forming)/hydroxylamine reductase